MTALGTTYTFTTNLPLLGRFEADVPVAAMTEEAVSTAMPLLMPRLGWALVAVTAGAFLGSVLANWLVPARR